MIKGLDYIGNAAVTLCHDGQGRYLLGLRSDKCRDEHNRWDPIGSGGIEFGDSIDETIRKEVKEECGADVLHIEFIGTREVFREHEGKKTHWIQFDHLVQINPEQVRITEPDKCLDLRWCTIDEFPEPMHSQFPFFIEKYKDKL
ncbi:MAG: 8-oxo-dGTP diphosphatase [Acidimicrobiales bacterium]|jgi:8-oxo-dGTP diphosphatase